MEVIKLSTHHDTKKKMLLYKGNECCICGYNKCDAALHFHHTDPSEKEFNLSEMYHKSWYEVEQELDKCILVCANCHAELHYY
jgi:hypothetical protein